MPHLSEKSRGVIRNFVASGGPVSLADYRDTCHEICGDADVLGHAAVEDRVAGISNETNWKAYFPPGWKCCPVVAPFDNIGRPMSVDGVEAGEQLHYLLIDDHGQTVFGFSGNPAGLFDKLPAEVKNLAFTIPDQQQDLSDEFRNACLKLRDLLS